MYDKKTHRNVGGLGDMNSVKNRPLNNVTEGLGELDVNFKYNGKVGGLGEMLPAYAFRFPQHDAQGLGEPSGIPFRTPLPEGLGDFNAKAA